MLISEDDQESDSEVDLRKRMQEQKWLLDEEQMNEEEIKKQIQQTDFIRFQLKIKELGEEKLLKQYTNQHVVEQ